MGVSLRCRPDNLSEIDRDVSGQHSWIVNYGERHRAGLRVGTAPTESTANYLVNKRMNKEQVNKSQQMTWSKRGANLLLQVRCALGVVHGLPSACSSVAGSDHSVRKSLSIQALTSGLKICSNNFRAQPIAPHEQTNDRFLQELIDRRFGVAAVEHFYFLLDEHHILVEC
jgi:hypothetical protein